MRQTNTSIHNFKTVNLFRIQINIPELLSNIFIIIQKTSVQKSKNTYLCIGLNGFEPLDISFLSIIRINKTKNANKILF